MAKCCKAIIVTCEHGGNRVPARYAHHFSDFKDKVDSHRGYDPGALDLARAISSALAAPLLYSTTTRLLIELNRSRGHRDLYSRVTRDLEQKEKDWILQNYYLPYRARVQKAIADLHARNQYVIHLSIHSFTPILNERTRTADIGLLYDPRRPKERGLCAAWRQALKEEWPDGRVRMNYPYRGTSDGFTTHLRHTLPRNIYCGLELEVNQKFFFESEQAWATMKTYLINSLIKTLQATGNGS